MQLMLGFMQSLWGMQWFWRIWVALLMVMNAVMPLFYVEYFEAQLVLAVFILAAVTQMFIFQRLGFVRLLGLGHIYWLPMLAWLLLHYDWAKMDAGLAQWLLLLMLVNSISLLIDSVDVLRYWRGERSAQ